jgi:uncharacterized membrane protein
LNFLRALPYALGVFFVGAGAAHFVWPDAYARIVPDSLPAHRSLVLVSGVAEMLGGIGVLFPRTRTAAGWGLLALLVAVFPANVNMALNAPRFHDTAPAWALWTRLPLQFVLGWLVAIGTLRPR